MFRVFFLFLFCTATLAQIPQLFCDDTEATTCQLRNVVLSRDQPRYDVISTQSEILKVLMKDQTLAVLSPDICETFPRLTSLYATSSLIQIVDQDALASCFALTILDLNTNQIQVLPPDVFRNNFRLSLINLKVNRIGMIFDDQFENNVNLESLYLADNALESFPARAVRNCGRLRMLELHTNNFFELDVGGIVKNCPRLKEAMINGTWYRVVGSMA